MQYIFTKKYQFYFSFILEDLKKKKQKKNEKRLHNAKTFQQ